MLKRLFIHYIADEARPMLRLAIPLVLVCLMYVGFSASGVSSPASTTAAAPSLSYMYLGGLPPG